MLKIIRRFLAFCQKQNRNKFYLSIFLSFIESMFNGLKIVAIYFLLSSAFSDSFDRRMPLITLGIMLISVIGQCAVRYFATMLQTDGGYSTCALKRMEIAEHLRYVPMGYFNNNSIGQVLSVTTNTMQFLEGMATRIIMLVSSSALTTLVITILVFTFDYRIGFILLLGLILCLLASAYLMRKANELAPEKQECETRLVSEIVEYIEGISEVKSYNLTGSKCEALNKANDDNANSFYKMERSFTPIIGIEAFLIKLTGIAMVFFSIMFSLNGSLAIAKAITIIIMSFVVLASLEGSSAYNGLLRNIDMCVERANRIMEVPQMNLEGIKEKPTSYDIEAKNIEFSYERKKIINDVSFKIPYGATTAIVGPSGGGKTTLTKLIARFFDVDKGSITLGGVNIKDYNYDTLMSSFSFVFQDVFLFNDTIANNIRFGNKEASMDEVIEVAKKARCHEFIMKLPNGYDTVLGDDGVSLSGGERQRLSIARAIMKDAPIIILDEATANVDPENECELVSAVNELTHNKTIIMIAHRLKTVMNASQILVVENGRIKERGTHSELMKQNGLYKRFIEGREKAVSWKI